MEKTRWPSTPQGGKEVTSHFESSLTNIQDGFGGVCIGPVTSSWGTEGTGVQGHGDSLGIW